MAKWTQNTEYWLKKHLRPLNSQENYHLPHIFLFPIWKNKHDWFVRFEAQFWQFLKYNLLGVNVLFPPLTPCTKSGVWAPVWRTDNGAFPTGPSPLPLLFPLRLCHSFSPLTVKAPGQDCHKKDYLSDQWWNWFQPALFISLQQKRNWLGNVSSLWRAQQLTWAGNTQLTWAAFHFVLRECNTLTS